MEEVGIRPRHPTSSDHFTGSEVIRDIVIGMSDCLTVPFALAAGLSGAVGSTGIIVTAGLAEVAAGSIAMGLGGYLAARSDAEHYAGERKREHREVAELPEVEMEEVAQIFRSYGLADEEIAPVLRALLGPTRGMGRFHDSLRIGPGGAGSQGARTAP